MIVQGARQYAALAAFYTVGWWAGWILDRPHEHWWAHGIVALPLGLLVAGCQWWAGRRRQGVLVPASPIPKKVAWSIAGVLVIVVFVLAATRNAPAQYAAAAVLSAAAVFAAAQSPSYRPRSR